MKNKNNIKKIFIITTIIILLAAIATPAVFAAELDYVTDDTDESFLTETQWKTLNDKARNISEQYKCGVYIVIVDDMFDYAFDEYDEEFNDNAPDAERFAYWVYRKYDLGYGENKNCVLFCLSTADRDYDFRVWGNDAKAAFTFYGIDTMLDRHLLPLLGDDEYYKAFTKYLDKSEEYLQMASEGKPFDKDNDHEYDGIYFIIKLAVVILLPLIIAGIVCSGWKSKMKTAKTARTADNYIPENGFKLTSKEDKFLYRTTTRTKIERESSSSGGGSSSGRGGSSGRSGKY